MNKFLALAILPSWLTIAFAGAVPADPAVRYTGFKSRVGTFTLADKPEFWNFDLNNRTEAQDAYWNIYVENGKVPFAWTGNTATLTPGEASPEWRAALVRALNFHRYYFWGAETVVYAEQSNLPVADFTPNTDGSLTGKTTRDAVQAAVTLLAANKTITHDVSGLAGANALSKFGAHSSLSAVGTSANAVVESFIVDYGSNNNLIGHREDMFAPSPYMDVGTALNGTFYMTGFFNDSLSGFANSYRNLANGILNTWPQKDTYIPYQMLSQVDTAEGARFSVLFANLPDASGAQVQVKRDGVSLAVKNIRGTYSGLGFDVAIPDIKTAPGKDQKYEVTMVNPYGNGATYSYSFTVFDPSVMQAGTGAPWPSTPIVNLSTRGIVGAGDNVLIAGFVIEGNEPLRIAVRAQGTSLKQFGLIGTAVNPRLEIYTGQTPMGSVDNWKQSPNFRLVQSYNLNPKEDADCVAVCTLTPGAYTAIVSDVNSGDAGGVGVVEVFNIDGASKSRLLNVSTRGVIGTGEKVLIAGIVLREKTTILVRTQAPGLAKFGVSGLATGTFLTVHDGTSKQIDENKGWKAPGNERLQGDLSYLAPSSEKEAAKIITLDAGAWTFMVSPSDGIPGVGLVEVFKID
jgi:hypothetical protein